jgi:hypothetical protein
MIIQSVEGMPGANIGGYNMNKLRYTDYTVLIVTNERDLRALVAVKNQESKEIILL